MPQRRLISFDWAMKKLLRSKANFEILEGFLSELLKDDIHILEILESESNKEERRAKFNRVDLKVKNQTGEIIIIEVQHEREFDYLHRILFGTSRVITEHLRESEPYSEIVKVISINILYFDLGQGEDYVYRGTTRFKGLHAHDLLELSEDQRELYHKRKIHELFPEYYLIKVNKFDDIAKDTWDEWIYFLKNEEIKKNFEAKGLKKAKQELDMLKMPEQDRIAYARYQDDLHHQASMVESSYTIGMKKGEKKGRAEGKEEGRAQGKKEGRAQGKEEGRAEEKKEIALKLAAAGILDIETVAEMTDLSVKEIEALRSGL